MCTEVEIEKAEENTEPQHVANEYSESEGEEAARLLGPYQGFSSAPSPSISPSSFALSDFVCLWTTSIISVFLIRL